MTDAADPPLADHVAESVDQIATFHQEHYRSATPLQRVMDTLTEQLGRPVFVALVVAGIVAWLVFAAVKTGGHVEDRLFTWLEVAATLAALVVAMLILVTQRRQDKLSERRAQLTLELAILADRKNAKIIALLEELRRDHPDVPDREDAESAEMAKPADPQSVLAAIDERNAQPGAGGKTEPDGGSDAPPPSKP
jgi:uncharacterized membrane protein